MRPSVQQPKQDKWYQESLSEILPARAEQRVLKGEGVPPVGLEPTLLAPEANALSAELQGQH